MTSAVTAEDRALLKAARAWARPSTARSTWQVVSTLALLGATLGAMAAVGAAWAWLLSPILAGMLVRVFVLQHDCGHRSLFVRRRTNDVVGRVLAVFTGVAHDGWRVEHDWHHSVTGRKDRRGIDLFNSPMTVAEAMAAPARADAVQKKVHPRTIAWLGMLALLVDRRRQGGFFFGRPGFVWRYDDRFVVAGLWLNNLLHLLWLVALGGWMGPLIFFTAVLPAMVLSGMVGALLFWVQHNFETSPVEPPGRWRFVAAAVEGSSYLRLPALGRYFTADIGIHHVHHLCAHIPNYRLEACRRQIPALAAVAPLTRRDIANSFRLHYWDEDRRRRVARDACR